MYNIAKASEQDRRVLFRNTAQQTGLHEAIKKLLTVPQRRGSGG